MDNIQVPLPENDIVMLWTVSQKMSAVWETELSQLEK